MNTEKYTSLLPICRKDDKKIKGTFRQRNELLKYIFILQSLDKDPSPSSSSCQTAAVISQIKNISATLFANLHGIHLGDRQANERVSIFEEWVIISDQKYSKSCLTYIAEAVQFKKFTDFLHAITSIKVCSKEIPKEIMKLKVLNLCLKWWNSIFMQQHQYKSAVELASDFVDVMEILWCYLKFDYCPAIYFNKILAKHSLPEIYVSGAPRDYFPAMDYAIVFEENAFPNFDESFISMLKYNALFSELPNKSGCCKIIATDFINDNIATFEYLVQPSSVEKYNKAFDQLRDTKYEEVNPELKEKMKAYDARECAPFIRCLFFRKRVIPQRRNMLGKYCDIREENEYFSYSFVQSESSASNNNHIDGTVVEIGIQTDEQMRETADKAIQTAHIFDDDFCVNDSDEIQMEIDNVGGVDLASSCSIIKPSILGTSRKSRRILEKANKVTSNAVEVPNICDASRAADDDDRDEIVSNSDGFHCFHKGDVQKYLSACDSKFKGDSHSALSHLAIHGYSIKKALERIDLLESLPMKRIHTDLGIWSKKEMQTFVKILSDNYQWKDGKLKKHPFWVKKVNKHLPDKSPKNCSIFYYFLKSAGFSFRCQTFKETSKFFKSTVKLQCENCINKLWNQSNLKQQSFNLCALCKLYLKLYEKQRPNAQALSEPFDFSFLLPTES